MRIIFFLLLCATTLAAQKHNYNWVMGYEDFVTPNPNWGGLIMNFNTRVPSFQKLTTHLNMDSEGISCSDSSGRLLFYSNGVKINNRNHTLMENGDSLNPGPYWESHKFWGFVGPGNAVVLPAPAGQNQYYLFHLGHFLTNNSAGYTPLYYSLIDMNANAGLGRVTEKNVLLLQDTLINPVAVKHGNGRDWWLIYAKKSSPLYYIYLLDTDGIHGPMKQTLDPVPAMLQEGSLCFGSPDGNTYIRSQLIDGIRIYDFNRCTGQLGNLRFLPKTDNLTGGAFSSDSRMVYFNNQRYLVQVDLNALDTAAYRDTLAHLDRSASPGPPFFNLLGWPIQGPDGKIYLGTLNITFKLHVINRPELPGAAADIQLNGVDLPRVNANTTINSVNYKLGEWEQSPCDTINLQQTGDGFTPTYYDPDHWRPAKQAESRVIHFVPGHPSAIPTPVGPDPMNPAENTGPEAVEARHPRPSDFQEQNPDPAYEKHD